MFFETKESDDVDNPQVNDEDDGEEDNNDVGELIVSFERL